MKFGNAKMRKKKDLLFYCILALMLFKQDTLEVEEKSIVEICSTSIFPYELIEMVIFIYVSWVRKIII